MAVDELTETFAALADPTRRAILTRLADGEATVNELAEPFPITVQAVSKHLKVLERAGLITRGRSAQLRPSRLHGPRLAEAAEWLEQYRPFWQDASTGSTSALQGAGAPMSSRPRATSPAPGGSPSPACSLLPATASGVNGPIPRPSQTGSEQPAERRRRPRSRWTSGPEAP